MKSPRIKITLVTVAALGAALLSGCGGGDNGPTSPPGGTGPTWSSGNFSNGVFVRTFTEVGSWDYRCTLHQPGMDGVVNVDAGSPNDSVEVSLDGVTFNPASVTVKQGGYVKWVIGSPAMLHNVTRP